MLLAKKGLPPIQHRNWGMVRPQASVQAVHDESTRTNFACTTIRIIILFLIPCNIYISAMLGNIFAFNLWYG